VAEIVPQNNYVVNYAGVNITDDVSRYLSKLKYKDSTKGKADEVEIVIDDSEGRWRNEWYPGKRDRINALISSGGPFLDCGNFEIDLIDYDFAPDTLTIHGLATGVTKDLRTKKYKSHESKSLKQIAQSICDAQSLTLDTGTSVVTKKKEVQIDIDKIELIKSDLSEIDQADTNKVITALQTIGPKVGTVARDLRAKDLATEAGIIEEGWRWLSKTHYTADAINYYSNRLAQVQNMLSPYLQKTEKIVVQNDLSSIIIERSTQNGETDLAYLHRIAAKYGFYFNIKGDTMVFYQVYSLESRSPSLTLTRTQLSKCSIKDTTVGTAQSATVTHHNPNTNEVVTGTAKQEALFPYFKYETGVSGKRLRCKIFHRFTSGSF
jgi:phage protein D